MNADVVIGLMLDSVTTAAILVIVSLGLLIAFGMMRIINFAHGGFLAVGAYTTVVATENGWPVWVPFILGPCAAAAVALIVEPIVLRRLYRRPLDMILATWGLSLIIVQLITLVFGRGTHLVKTIELKPLELLGEHYSSYRLLLVALALLVCLAVYLILQKTRVGLVGRAVIMDEDLAQTFGINTQVVRLVTFALGSALAGLAGVLLVPIASVDPNMGLPWLIFAFMIVLLIGMSVSALITSCLVLGAAQMVVGYTVSATLATLVVPALVVLILRFRPSGFAKHISVFPQGQ